MDKSKLQNEQTDELVKALLSLSDEKECYAVLEDLCTMREVRDLAQRLSVARLLRRGVTYSDIVEKTGASTATIGRVNRALNYGAGGYESILRRLEKPDERED